MFQPSPNRNNVLRYGSGQASRNEAAIRNTISTPQRRSRNGHGRRAELSPFQRNLEFPPRRDGNINQRRRLSMNFERYAAEGNRFVNDVAEEINISRNAASRVTRAVFHAVRDRLPPNDAVQFGQGLPMALKGVYFDQYDLSDSPVIIRHADQFIDFVIEKNVMNANVDFPDDYSVVKAVRGVFAVLRKYLDPGQIAQIQKLMGKEIRNLVWPKIGAAHFRRVRQSPARRRPAQGYPAIA